MIFLALCRDYDEGLKTMALLTLMFNSLRIPVAPHKTVGPVQRIEYLGIWLDTIQMLAQLPSEKLVRINRVQSKTHSYKERTAVAAGAS